ncbi:MAG: hypothetical protein SA339_12855 [Methanomassiliicoccus sp.]|nr:hypothetical protein [Methanomassiliicoccus sp.]
MDFTSYVAAAIGFAPPIALMLWTLQRYTYPKVERPYFSDPRLFGMFTVGIVIGALLYLVSIFLSAEYAFVGFLLEEAVKLMIMNMPRFQRRADTPFYAFGLSAGMATALAYGVINRALTMTGFDALAITIMVAYSIMTALLQISTGTTIGMGVARGTPWPFFGQAVVVNLAYVLMLAPSSTAFVGSGAMASVLFVAAFVFVALYYYYVHQKMLPLYVREALVKLGENKPKKARKVPRTKD